MDRLVQRNVRKAYNAQKAAKAQEKFCEKHHYPSFAPTDGQCYRCGKNIYIYMECDKHQRGYTVKDASTKLITRCPYCYASFVE